MKLEPISKKNFLLGSYENIVFAGGGNRCWWQAGMIETLSKHLAITPKSLTGTSAGGAVAVAFATQRIQFALDDCIRLYSANSSNIIWKNIISGKRPFPQSYLYRVWTENFFDQQAFSYLKSQQLSIKISLTRPTQYLPLSLSVCLGLILYSSKKFLFKNLHSMFPYYLGFRTEQIDLSLCTSVTEALDLLNASIATPPITPAAKFKNQFALDGGFYDNIPLPVPTEHNPAKTLVLLTRFRPTLPQIFKLNGRTYIQPRAKIPIVNWDSTAANNLVDVFQLGVNDAYALLTQ